MKENIIEFAKTKWRNNQKHYTEQIITEIDGKLKEMHICEYLNFL